MLTQSVRGRLGRVLEREVERGLAGTASQALERDLESVLERSQGASDEQVALALGIALALAMAERPCP